MYSIILSVLCLFMISACKSDSGIWSYTSQNEWTNVCLTGKQQSPINIDTKVVKVNKSLKLDRIRYDFKYNYFNVINNGKTIMLELTGPDAIRKPPYLMGTALNNQEYRFAGLHFHWSDKYMNGSEHRIDERDPEMEMHLVHYNVKYGDLSNAVKYHDGLAVVAILFEVKGEDNPSLKPIIRGVIAVSQENNNSYIGNPAHYPLRLIDLFAKESRQDDSLFYRYHGSLTTPNCEESVTWLIYDATSKISVAQFREFEKDLAG